MTSRKILKGMIAFAVYAVMASMLMMPAAIEAASMPVFENLPPILNASIAQYQDLLHAAVTSDGYVYVTESTRNGISVFKAEGTYEGFIRNSQVQNPSGIAINNKGVIFVSSIGNGSVSMLNRKGESIGMLGSGINEFARPVHVAIDSTNNDVYVTDSNGGAIKVYSESGSYKTTFADSGNSPIASAVYGNELYVLDRPFVNGSQQAAIKAYNITSGAVRIFGEYGTGAGQLNLPKSMAVDGSGRLYVVDYFHKVVYCYDAARGIYLGAIYDNDRNRLIQPTGVAIAGNGRLYVASPSEGGLRSFGIDNYTVLAVNPSSLSFALTNGVLNPSSSVLSLSNAGKGAISYAVSALTDDGASWIELSGTSGVIPAGSGASDVVITINGSGLSAGAYSGTITVQDVDNSTVPPTVRDQRAIPVTLAVNNPTLQVSESALDFVAAPGSSTVMSRDITVTISNDMLGTASWNASVSTNGTGNWLGISPAASANAGNSSTISTITVDPSGLVAGTYAGTITFRANGAAGSPASLNVTLVLKADGSVSVSTNRQNAVFTISGPNGLSFSGSGKSWSQGSLPDGDYTISYGGISGSVTPAGETGTISAGGSLSFKGLYGENRNIVVGISGSRLSPARVRIFDSNLNLVKEIIPFGAAYIGHVTVATGDVDGDGYDEIIVAYGANKANPARIAIFSRDGSKLSGSDFVALDSNLFKYGARLAAGDLDGDGKAEIVVGAGPGSTNQSVVRVFSYAGGIITDTGLYATVFGTLYGANVAAGDIDGDGQDELIVAPGPDPAAAAAVSVMKIDTAVPGGWSVRQDSVTTLTPFAGIYGATVSAGDLDGDGKDEIIAGTGMNSAATGNKFVTMNGSGASFGLSADEGSSGGVEIASGDINGDGMAEIVTAYDPSKLANLTIKTYEKNSIKSFIAEAKTANGATVATGNLGY